MYKSPRYRIIKMTSEGVICEGINIVGTISLTKEELSLYKVINGKFTIPQERVKVERLDKHLWQVEHKIVEIEAPTGYSWNQCYEYFISQTVERILEIEGQTKREFVNFKTIMVLTTILGKHKIVCEIIRGLIRNINVIRTQ